MFTQKKLFRLLVLLVVAMNTKSTFCDRAQPLELMTEEEYYQYGVLHKRDLGCAAEYKATRYPGSCFKYLFSPDGHQYRSYLGIMLMGNRYTNIDAGKSCVKKVAVCLRNAAATGEVKVVQHLLKYYSGAPLFFGLPFFDTPSKLAAYYFASKKGHKVITQMIYEKLIKPDNACRTLIDQGWSLEQERADFLAREKAS